MNLVILVIQTTMCGLCAQALSHVRCFATPRTIACQAPLSMGFSWQEYWSGLPCPPLGVLPNLETEPRSPALQADSLPVEPPGKPVALYSEWEMHRKTNILGGDAGNNIYKNVDFFFLKLVKGIWGFSVLIYLLLHIFENFHNWVKNKCICYSIWKKNKCSSFKVLVFF